jgi:inosine-uridine nucleoside N-ribohydrolase
MELIVETDIGRDPDDFFTLCYLISAGVQIRAITVSPGDLDQVAVVKFLLKEVGLTIPVGVGRLNRIKSSVGGVHTELLRKYKFPSVFHDDGFGPIVIRETFNRYRNAELLCIGPLLSVGEYLSPHSSQKIFFVKRATMQGGFIGYDIHGVKVPELDKFKGLTTCLTFNLGGDNEGAMTYISSKMIRERNWIGKNICHTIEYDENVHNFILSIKPHDRAGELLREGMGMYLAKHKSKKFHDPTAAVCMLHPEIATWTKGKMYYDRGKWGATLNENGDNIAIDVDRSQLWNFIAKGE